MWFLPLTFKKLSFIWDMTGKTGSESSRAAFSRLLRTLCQASHSRLIFRGVSGLIWAEARHLLISPGSEATKRWNSFFRIGQPGRPGPWFSWFSSLCEVVLDETRWQLDKWKIWAKELRFFENIQHSIIWKHLALPDVLWKRFTLSFQACA